MEETPRKKILIKVKKPSEIPALNPEIKREKNPFPSEIKPMTDPQARYYLLSVHQIKTIDWLANNENEEQGYYKELLQSHPEKSNELGTGCAYATLGVIARFEDAKDIIEKNKRNICKDGKYNIACIEKMPFGICQEHTKRWFFEMNCIPSGKGYKYESKQLSKEQAKVYESFFGTHTVVGWN